MNLSNEYLREYSFYIQNECLPNGWNVVSLSQVSHVITDGTHKTPKYLKSGIRFISTKNIKPFMPINWDSYERYISFEEHEQLIKRCCPKYDDVVFPRIGTLGYAKRIDFFEEVSLFVGLGLIKPIKECVLPKYLELYMNTPYISKLSVDKANGSGRMTLPLEESRRFPIPIPPFAEQHRIVAKIEELFSELDKGIENLKTAHAQLKVYRQALLKHAFEGKLTAQWREHNKDKLETSSALQERIQTERAARYQQQLTDWQAAGQPGNKPKAPKPLPPLTNEELAELPQGWIRLCVENLCDIEDGDRGEHYPTKNDFLDNGYCLFLNAKNVTKRGFAFHELSFISQKKNLELRKGKLKRGDIVFTSRGTLGNIAHYDESINYEHIRINSGMFILRNYDAALTPDFLYYHLNSPIITSQIETLQSGTAQPQLPIREFKSFWFVTPSKLEQEQIVQELESKLSEVDQLEQTISTVLQQSEALRQSVLKKAFSGTLVTQDANDEPASVLLARIKAEIATKPANKRLAKDYIWLKMRY